MKKLILSIAVLAFIGCSDRQKDEIEPTQQAYIKVNKNRIFVYSYPKKMSIEQLKTYIQNNPPMSSDRRMTASYYFKEGKRMPLSGFSTTKDISKANEFLYNSDEIDKWDLAYMKSFKGDVKIVNCTVSKDALCR